MIDQRIAPPLRDADGDGLRFAANLKWLFTDVPIEDRIRVAAEHGFRAVEYPAPYEFSVDSLRRMLTQGGVELALINTPPRTESGRTVTGIACDPSLRTEFRSGVELALEYAAGLDVPLVHVVAGPVPADVPFERAWAEYLLNIAWASEIARSTGITLLIEPQNLRSSPGFALTSQGQAASVIDAVGSDRLRLLFDVFHVQVQEGGVTEKLVRFAPIIGHIQIADAPDRTEPGTGELSWRHVFRQLKQIGYRGWIGCEYSATTPEGLRVDWLKTWEE
ncbi:hydroxypyruvate isomerase family protein [Leifsonia bigeumensis]|uniref:Hydroxypyruvate isomerase family protein n=1 Tax=Leifsonella bigeumensis TaxID=433643 RepID=A0ABP7FHB7_9MICO